MKKIYYFISGYFLLWIVLFEFILPVNNILPKPSVVLLAFPDLAKHYNLWLNIISSVSAIYLAMGAAWFFVWLLRNQIMNRKHVFTLFIDSLEWFSRFIPGIVLSLLIIYWFRSVEYIKYIFIFLTTFMSIIIKVENEVKNVPGEYLDSSLSLGIKDNNFVKWKIFEPAIAKHLASLHFYLWSMLLVFEYIKGGFGLGSMFHAAMTFNDLSGLFSGLFITGIIIWAGTVLLDYYIKKYFFWN